MFEPTESTGEKQPRILRGRVDSFALYEITEHELDLLENGSPSSIYFNFSVFLLSVAVSFFTALITSTMSLTVFVIFLVITVVGASVGSFLLLLWIRSRASISSVVKRIRARIPSERILIEGEQS